jgi:dipeptidyl aminopeptidase/acylaminoacyl peptidase
MVKFVFHAGVFLLAAAPLTAHGASGPVGGETAQAAAWSTAPKVVVEQETIAFDSQGARLQGTLFFPSRQQHRPTVIVLHGASSPSRDLPLYHHLEQMLPPLGIAVFVFDRRGSGASTGGGSTAYDFHVLADDGVAAGKALAGDAHVDAARIGYWGISQGGWLALLAASKDPRGLSSRSRFRRR